MTNLSCEKPVSFCLYPEDNSPGQSFLVPSINSPANSRTVSEGYKYLPTECETTQNFVSNDRHICGQCGKNLVSIVQFLQHKCTHIESGHRESCEFCHLPFSRQATLANHFRHKHNITFSKEKLSSHDKKDFIKRHRKSGQSFGNSMLEQNMDMNTDAEYCRETLFVNEGKQNNITTDLYTYERIFKEPIHSDNQIKIIDSKLEKDKMNENDKADTADLCKRKYTCSKEIIEFIGNIKVAKELLNHHDNIVINMHESFNVQQQMTAENESSLGDLRTANGYETSEFSVSTSNAMSDMCPLDSNRHILIDVMNPCADADDSNVLCTTFDNGQNMKMFAERNFTEVKTETKSTAESTETNSTNLDHRHVVSVADTNNVTCISMENGTVVGDENIKSCNSEIGKRNMNSSPYLTRFSKKQIVLMKNGETLPQELNMPDFCFRYIVAKSGKNSANAGRDNFICLICKKSFNWRSAICRHMRESHSDVLISGHCIDMVITNGADNTEIMENATSNNGICNSDNSSENIMKMSEYMQFEASQKPYQRLRGVETQDLPGDFPCSKCGKIFSRLRYLRKHEAYHKAENMYICSVCGKRFKTSNNLNQHFKSHKERAAYKCIQCDFESTVNIAIHKHRQIHQQGSSICDICGCAYNDKSTLAKHKQVHDPARPYACNYPGCTWRFRTMAFCNAHYRMHTQDFKALFDCGICGYSFRQKHHLQRHERVVHKLVPQAKPDKYEKYMAEDTNKFHQNPQQDCEEINHKEMRTSEINLIINDGTVENMDHSGDHFDLERALQNGHLVIASGDVDGLNYDMTDIGTNVVYQTFLQDGDGNQLDSSAILISQSDGIHIMGYQHEEITETVNREVVETSISIEQG